jgi:hypothetical protein
MISPDTRAPSVQETRIRLEAIEGGVARFESGHRCAVLELGGGEVAAGNEDRQEAILAGLAAFLNALAFPVQLLLRAQPVDLRRYLERQEDRARSGELSQALADLARDHAAFVRGLARQRTLLERRFYVAITARLQASPANGRLAQLPRLVGRGAPPGDASGAGATEASLVRQLGFRCDEVSAQLRRVGIEARRLDDVGLAELYMAFWAPERARTQRLRQQLQDYTTLVVGGRAAAGAR